MKTSKRPPDVHIENHAEKKKKKLFLFFFPGDFGLRSPADSENISEEKCSATLIVAHASYYGAVDVDCPLIIAYTCICAVHLENGAQSRRTKGHGRGRYLPPPFAHECFLFCLPLDKNTVLVHMLVSCFVATHT